VLTAMTRERNEETVHCCRWCGTALGGKRPQARYCSPSHRIMDCRRRSRSPRGRGDDHDRSEPRAPQAEGQASASVPQTWEDVSYWERPYCPRCRSRCHLPVTHASFLPPVAE